MTMRQKLLLAAAALVFWVICGVAVVKLAVGAPPPGTDDGSALSGWYRSLQTPEGGSCCSEADCRAYADDKLRQRPGVGWEVFIEGDWRPVPPEKVLRGRPNPTGHAVACWLPSTGILCFVEPFMA